MYFAKLQGIQTLKSGMVNLYQNRMPVYEIMSGASIAIAAILLIIPGFFTDIIGFLLIFPLSRKLVFNQFVSNFKNKTDTKNKIIEGEFEDIDNDNDKKV